MRNLQIDHLFSELTRNAAFQSLVSRIASGAGVLRIDGLTLAAKALYAVLLHQATGRPQLIVVDGNKQAEALFPLLRTFAGLISSDPAPAPLLLPALDILPGQNMSPHAEILATRATALAELANGHGGITLAPVAAALSRTEPPRYYRQLTQTLRVHDEVPLDDLAAHLESVGYERRDPVEMVGEYSIRGGILDVFSPEQAQPVRVEFFGDEIESIRRFDPESQRSIHKLNECVLQPLTEFQKSRALLTELAGYLRDAPFDRIGVRGRDLPPAGEPFPGWELLLTAVRPRKSSLLEFFDKPLILIDEPELTKAAADRLWTRLREPAHTALVDPATAMIEWEEFSTLASDPAAGRGVLETRQIDMGGVSGESFHISTRPSMAFHGNLQVAIREAKTLLESGCRLAFFAPTAGEVERLADVFAEYSVPYRIDLRGEQVPEYLQQRAQSLASGVALIRGDVARGTVFQEGRLAIFGSEDLFESPDTVAKPGKSHQGRFSADQFDLKAGDYVVHVEHGVGQFLGVREIAQGDTKGDYMLIEYAGGNKLYVPLSRMDLVQRFRGEGEAKPVLDRMGGATWNRTRTKIKSKMRDMAEELLKLYAARRLARDSRFRPRATGSANLKTPSNSPKRATRKPPSPTSNATWKPRSPWTACSAAMSATARPKL